MITSTSAPSPSSAECSTFLLLHQLLAAAIDPSSSIYISLSTRCICAVSEKKISFVNAVICDVTLLFDKQAVGA